ncbi:MAG: hypothetical protein GXY95_08600 [Clostridiales bacterium]|jgi:hypothetical protein|nr:hypothetical protein [Clostridiales bacterium]HOA34238.1 hypothetical protein [Clostridiales bacterium]HOJ35015.1 hypothetical protein [Clostridiales bacterium]HOL78730.1 hypothetical protein [Clostridiales bacterium]HPP68455.1 hypothetical protein [Clostridiales bacterium]
MKLRGSDDQINELISTLKSYDKDKLSKFIDRNLDSRQKKRLEEVLSNDKKLNEMLNSELGRELRKKIEDM